MLFSVGGILNVSLNYNTSPMKQKFKNLNREIGRYLRCLSGNAFQKRSKAREFKNFYYDDINTYLPLYYFHYFAGELDDDTLHVMSLPRCGVRDKVGVSTYSRAKRYALQGE